MTDLVNENEIKALIDKIKNLTHKEKTHILSILKKHSIEFTKNSNGYFFNLNKISTDVMEELSKCVELIEKNRNLLVILDKKRAEQLEYYRDLIQTKLNKTIEIKRIEYIQKFFIEDDHDFKQFIRKKYQRAKVAQDKDIDIETLMKNHMSAAKYKKDSVYYKILQAFTRKARVSKTNDDVEGNSTFCGGDETGDYEADFTGGDYDLSDEYYNPEAENIETVEDIENLENLENIENAEDLSEVEADLNVREEVAEPVEVDEEFSEDKFEYFKRLLKNEHGYAFDYDKDVRMECEEYIT